MESEKRIIIKGVHILSHNHDQIEPDDPTKDAVELSDLLPEGAFRGRGTFEITVRFTPEGE